MENRINYAAEDHRIISRFSLAILGCLNIGIGIGTQLPLYMGGLAIACGAFALLYYYYRTQRELLQHNQQNETCRQVAEERLVKHLAPEVASGKAAQAV